jgi:hypothetical protein
VVFVNNYILSQAIPSLGQTLKLIIIFSAFLLPNIMAIYSFSENIKKVKTTVILFGLWSIFIGVGSVAIQQPIFIIIMCLCFLAVNITSLILIYIGVKNASKA